MEQMDLWDNLSVHKWSECYIVWYREGMDLMVIQVREDYQEQMDAQGNQYVIISITV